MCVVQKMESSGQWRQMEEMLFAGLAVEQGVFRLRCRPGKSMTGHRGRKWVYRHIWFLPTCLILRVTKDSCFCDEESLGPLKFTNKFQPFWFRVVSKSLLNQNSAPGSIRLEMELA